ncbi:MAG: hypoxanthine phosphoribosyltransferase, partial [Actinobacteria bacterium]|nr:hypoxanthine phosphoribosyltransferase [Actinomycetota bacterium]
MDLAAVAGDIERVIVTEEALQARIKELAAQIDRDYEGKDLL